MDANQIIAIVGAVASFLFVTLIPNIIILVKKWKEAKNAKTEAEKEAVYNDLLCQMNKLIANAEAAYKQVDEIVKQKGGQGSGAAKKDNVMTKLQNYCLQKGVAFDEEYWSKKIDDTVAMTKQVNIKG